MSDILRYGERQQYPPVQSLSGLLEWQAKANPDTTAIVAPGRIPLTYAELYTHTKDVVKTLNDLGLGRNDRVAIVLPNGPELAVVFLSVAAGATTAPLNPAYRAGEFEFYLADLGAKALIVQAGLDSPAITAAQRYGIPVLELFPLKKARAGLFQLNGKGDSAPTKGGFARPEDVALVLHTSGTTSRPKLVPLTQANICTLAYNIQTAFELSPHDRCLNIMPLFHAHGLIIGIISSLRAGASVACPPGFEAGLFFNWLEELRPTWYTAAPALHQAILDHAVLYPETVPPISLRFVRSSAAPLSTHLLARLENLFHAPVIEGYGMTECVQISSNGLQPGRRKAGSVGLAAGPDVAIMDPAQPRLLSQGETGEIVIRGDCIMQAYENNPEANQSAFSGGWFRTGDQGYFDDDGCLFINGRLKEIINRGGEKISPREVDEALAEHPEIAQAVTFAVPHPTLGEDVAAAVVLRQKGTSRYEPGA